jgi:putative GTP pyrophosphokinase
MPNTLQDPTKLRQIFDANFNALEAALRRFQDELRGHLKQMSINGHVKARVKKFEGFYEKLHRNHRDGERSPITDLLALRIICPFAEDVTKIERVLTQNYTVREVLHKGEDRSFREFGYESTHLLVQVPWDDIETPLMPGAEWVFEVQLRTTLQDAWAEVEHELIYKGETSLPNESVRRKLAAINAALSLADTIFQEIRDQMRELKQLQDKRRQMVQERSHLMDQDHMSRTLQRSALEHPEFLANAGTKERIEKTLMLALQYHSHEQYDDAIEMYTRALELGPEPRIRSIIHNHRGMAHFICQQTDQARKDFTLAISNNPDNFRALNNRATCYKILGDIGEAMIDWKLSLEIRKDQEDPLLQLAQCSLDSKYYEEALRLVDQAISLHPESDRGKKLRQKISAKLLA